MYRVAAAVWLLGWAMFSVPWSSFTAEPQVEHVDRELFRVARRDNVRNFLYYVPAGVIGVGLGLGAAGTVVGAAALSAAAETLQLFSTGRVPSITDLTLNIAGAAVGVGLALVVRARRSRSATAYGEP
jgi:VanZ family protein